MDNVNYENTEMNQMQENVPQYYAPAYQHPVNRNLLKFILLSIITCGIYGIVTWCKMITELNVAASRYDGKRTCPYFAATVLGSCTFGIFLLVWQHNLANRVGAEVVRRGYDYKFSAVDFWLWGVLGSFIMVGPFVFLHKLLKSMNMINTSYNYYG